MSFITRFFQKVALSLLLLAAALAPPALFAQEKSVSFVEPYTQLDSSVVVAASGSQTYFVQNFPIGEAWVLTLANVGTTDPGQKLSVESYQSNASGITNYSQNHGAFAFTWNVWLGSQLGQSAYMGLTNGNGTMPISCNNTVDPTIGQNLQCVGGTSSGEYLAFIVKNAGTVGVTLSVGLTAAAPNTELFAQFAQAVKEIVFPSTSAGQTTYYASPVYGCDSLTHTSNALGAGAAATIVTGPAFGSPASFDEWGFCGLNLSASASTNVTIEIGTGTNCGTGTTVLQTIYGVGSGLVIWRAPNESAQNSLTYALSAGGMSICVVSSAAATVDATAFTSF